MSRALALLLLQCAVALAKDPASPDALEAPRRLGALLRQAAVEYERGDYVAVIGRLGRLSGPAAQDLSVLNLRAAALGKTGDYAQALRILDRIVEAQPDYYPAAYNAAELRFRAGDREGALASYQSLLERDRDNELLRFKVFLCLDAMGRQEQAAGAARELNAAGLTPAWYYAQAVGARRRGDEAGARRYLRAAKAVYGDERCRLFDESLAAAKM